MDESQRVRSVSGQAVRHGYLLGACSRKLAPCTHQMRLRSRKGQTSAEGGLCRSAAAARAQVAEHLMPAKWRKALSRTSAYRRARSHLKRLVWARYGPAALMLYGADCGPAAFKRLEVESEPLFRMPAEPVRSIIARPEPFPIRPTSDANSCGNIGLLGCRS